jgi:ribA/ribD-fused uncharacterized protein
MKKRSAPSRNGTQRTAKTSEALEKEVRFYRANEKPYGAFSNLYRSPVRFEDREFPTAEHAYQAGKPVKEKVRDWILSAPSPALVAMAAHGLYTWDIVPNWSRIKVDRMRQVLRAKFIPNEKLRSLLLSTGNARLVEAGRTDNAVNREWGEVNGRGMNKLGLLLMELRVELRNQQVTATKPRKGAKRPANRQSDGLAAAV